MKYYLLSFALLFISISGFAQQTASQILSAAERDYEQGKLMSIPRRLEPIFEWEKEEGFSKAEKIRARKLLTLVYIFTDNEPKAEESMVQLLKLDPEHKRDPREDPAEFYFLYDQFRTKPIFRVALRVGVNKSFPQVIEKHGVYNTASVGKYYNGVDGDNDVNTQGSLGIGYFAELAFERHILWGIEAGVGFEYRLSTYDVDQQLNESSITTFISSEQTYFRTPIFLRYNYGYFKESGPIPYVTIGGTYDYLVDARYAEATRQGGTSFSPTQTIVLTDIELEQARRNNFSVFGALGVKFRIKTHFLTLEAKYDRSLMNFINSENRWNSQNEVVWDLAYAEDDLRLNFVSFSVGYTHSIYSPKKLKEFK